LKKYTQEWAAAQFGKQHAVEIADIISKYSKYNGRRKPELLDADTYSLLNYREAELVTKAYDTLLKIAEKINTHLPAEYKDAYFQLVLHPVKATANLYNLYLNVARNKQFAAANDFGTNGYADKANMYFTKDSLITLEYHAIAGGKWNHMMSQTHIGYTYWQQPPFNKMPAVKYIRIDSAVKWAIRPDFNSYPKDSIAPANKKGSFYERDGYVSIEASHFTKAVNSNRISWKILPDHGKTGDAVTQFPVTADDQSPAGNSPRLEYDVYFRDTGAVKLKAYFSPTLNFHNDAGLQYAISIDNEKPQILSINKDDNNVRTWSTWVANNIIISTTNHTIRTPGKHVIKYWMVSPGIVLQKIVADRGGLKASYLGPPETRFK
jgi:hypothetical protein